MNKTHTLAHMEGQQLWTDLQKANTEIRRLSAEVRAAFLAGCDYGTKYAGDYYLGTPERDRGYKAWQKERVLGKQTHE